MRVALTPGGSLTREGRDEALELLKKADNDWQDRVLRAEIRDFLERFEAR